MGKHSNADGENADKELQKGDDLPEKWLSDQAGGKGSCATRSFLTGLGYSESEIGGSCVEYENPYAGSGGGERPANNEEGGEGGEESGG